MQPRLVTLQFTFCFNNQFTIYVHIQFLVAFYSFYGIIKLSQQSVNFKFLGTISIFSHKAKFMLKYFEEYFLCLVCSVVKL